MGINDRFLPDKAIDLIDEAGSRVRLFNSQLPAGAQELNKELRSVVKSKDEMIRLQEFETKSTGDGPVVTEEDIAEIVAAWTSVPVSKLTKDESEKLLQIEETLHNRIIGQHEAVS